MHKYGFETQALLLSIKMFGIGQSNVCTHHQVAQLFFCCIMKWLSHGVHSLDSDFQVFEIFRTLKMIGNDLTFLKKPQWEIKVMIWSDVTSMVLSALVKAEESFEISCSMVELSSSLSL